MADAAPWLDELAGAVADHEAVDWDRLRARLDTGTRDSRAAALELIERATTKSATATATATSSPRRLPAAALAVVWLACVITVTGLLAPVEWLGRRSPVPAPMVRLVAAGFGAAALVLVRAGRRDVRAVALGGFFACLGAAAVVPLLPTSAPLPWVAAAAMTLQRLFPDAFLAYFLWRFVIEFPRRRHFGPADGVAAWVTRASAVIGVWFFVANATLPLLAVDAPLRPLLQAAKRGAGKPYWLVLAALLLLAPLVAWLRTRGTEPAERARVRWFLGGLALGFAPLFLVVAGEALVPPFARLIARPAVRAGSGAVLFAFLLTIPITSTYAVVAHRVLALRVAMQRAMGFALARGTLLLLALLPTGGLLAHLQARRHLPLDALLASRATAAWAVGAGLSWALYAARRPLLQRLERWLVGSRRGAAVVVAELAQDARRATAPAQLAAVAHEHLASAVGATGAVLLLRDLAGRAGKTTVGAREEVAAGDFVAAGRDAPALGGTSGIVRLAAAGPEPVPFDAGRDSCLPWLLESDRAWLRATGTEVVAPLTTRAGDLCGLLAVAGARGGTGYREEDRQAIAAIAATTSLALERLLLSQSEAPATSATVAGECAWCGKVAPRPAGKCDCGGELSPAALPFELAGKFRLARVLGSGGMGVVYRAVDLELGRSVALKTLPRLKGGALERLRREARSMATFVHPNLALLFGVESWREVPVLVVEHLGGGSLAARLPPGLPPRLALQVAADVAGALDAMHRQGLLHRDVKPHNIAFAADGTPKLLDFGLAHLAAEGLAARDSDEDVGAPQGEDRLTLSGTVVGTPLYLSPEVLEGEMPSPAQDLWSLHLVLWESLTGEHPLARLPATQALQRLRLADLPFAKLRAAGIDRHLVALLAAGLARDPRRRPGTAAEVRAALLSALEIV